MKKAFLLPLIFIFLSGIAWTSKDATVEGIRFSSNKKHTRIVVDISGPIEFSENHLSNPDRLFFDLKNCSISASAKSFLSVNDEVLQSVRMAQFDKHTVRVVLDVKNSQKFSAIMLESPYRLVVDVYAEKDHVDQEKSNDDKNKPIEKSFRKVKTVVIDPGHGGKDPGAVGPNGLMEKDITLYVGKELGNILSNKHDVNVIYTRKSDTYIPLDDRTGIANAKDADLFVSIHVNASEKRNVRGIETYFLNWTNDSEAIRVAARENRITFKKMKEVQDGLQFILHDLARKNKNEESMRLAHSVQYSVVNELKQDYNKIEDLGVKYALFYVLVGAEMPSVLVEISFISNHEEEKRLSSDTYKNKIAEAIAKGVEAYIGQDSLIANPSMKSTPEG